MNVLSFFQPNHQHSSKDFGAFRRSWPFEMMSLSPALTTDDRNASAQLAGASGVVANLSSAPWQHLVQFQRSRKAGPSVTQISADLQCTDRTVERTLERIRRKLEKAEGL
ncbi:MAG: hypothetical protein L0Y71_08565 [Gemmataceae bacterium]|nr:hypothetical protein [Gemmataceae bacterium]